MKLNTGLNQLYQKLPPYYQFQEQEIQTIIKEYGAAWKLHYPEEHQFRWEISTLEDSESAFGLYHNDQLGYIVWVSPVQPNKVEEFILHILDYVSELGLETLKFGNQRDPFGLGWSGLPKTHSRLLACLQHRFGYSISESWIICELRDIQHLDPNNYIFDEPNLRFEKQENVEIGEWDLMTYQNQTVIGECSAWAIPTYFQTLTEGAKWVTIEWIGLEDGFVAKGIGRQLLQRQLSWQKAKGIDHVVLWTEKNNHPARRFFAKHGFKEIEEVISLERV